MPWHIESDNAECAGYAVVKDANGEVEGCHRTRAQAERQLAALYAAEPNASESRAEGHTPTSAMVEEAQRGLDWRQEHGRGGTEIGVARARDIVNRRALSADTIARMVSYFARHEVDKQGQGWSPNQDGYPSAGRIAWALWGGDPGRTWAENIVNQTRAGSGPAAIITDIDGTLALGGRVNNTLVQYLNKADAAIIVVTGRNESVRDSTRRYLESIGLDFQALEMSNGGNPNTFKKDTAARLLERYTILEAYENNPDARAAYESLGINAKNPMARRDAAQEILASFMRVN